MLRDLFHAGDLGLFVGPVADLEYLNIQDDLNRELEVVAQQLGECWFRFQ